MRILVIFAGSLFLVVLVTLFGQSDTSVAVPIQNVESAAVHDALSSPTPRSAASSTASTTAVASPPSPQATTRPHTTMMAERPAPMPSPTRKAVPMNATPFPARGTARSSCSADIYNCSDFKTQAEAQALFESCGGTAHDIHRLDRDNDGRVCETI
jgi:hypothetical protein